jgi:hypothetical protein
MGSQELNMTLSQIIARQSYYDIEVPEKGKLKIHLIIQDGKIQKPQDVTYQRGEGK